ncbi:hypothetical protein lerEdw1_004888 [Lerista edwardsae]|nr:hypothetical protein lerEdw1_004888 [Lerista edwardsae]
MEPAMEELMPRLLPVGGGDDDDDDDDLSEGDPAAPPRTPRQYLRRVQLEAAQCPAVVSARIDPRKLRKTRTASVLPKTDDEEGWKKFCLGERFCLDTAVELSSDEHEGIDYVQATVTNVLEYLTNWLPEKEFTPEMGRWLYALLACLEKPLLPEAHSLIRQLARRCSEARVLEENKNDENASALNLLICLVGRYFDQHDLADEPS